MNSARDRAISPVQGVDRVDNLTERAKKVKSKAIGRTVIEAYMRYVDWTGLPN